MSYAISVLSMKKRKSVVCPLRDSQINMSRSIPQKSSTFDFLLKNTTNMISMNAFNFNYNGNGGASQQSLYPLGAGTPEVVCSDCYAYLGATVKLIVDQDGNGGVTVLRGAVTGSTGKSMSP